VPEPSAALRRFFHWPEKVPELSFQLGEEVENAFFRI
jgi:hypothetical protein